MPPKKGVQKQELKKKPAKEEKRECILCSEEKPLALFPGKVTDSCSHVRDVCRVCMARTIDLEVNGKGNSTKILCPHPGCAGELKHADVQREAAQSVFERYDKLLFQKFLQAEHGFRWCASPGCGNGQIVEDIRSEADTGRGTFFRCHHCQQRTCAFHRCLWHTERTCDEYDSDAKRSEEVAMVQYLEREGVKRCPKCNHGIEKNGGCEHMTCRKSAGGCGAEFCFRCLADYQGPRGIAAVGNSAHKRSCPFYAANPEEDSHFSVGMRVRFVGRMRFESGDSLRDGDLVTVVQVPGNRGAVARVRTSTGLEFSAQAGMIRRDPDLEESDDSSHDSSDDNM